MKLEVGQKIDVYQTHNGTCFIGYKQCDLVVLFNTLKEKKYYYDLFEARKVGSLIVKLVK